LVKRPVFLDLLHKLAHCSGLPLKQQGLGAAGFRACAAAYASITVDCDLAVFAPGKRVLRALRDAAQAA
jgi:hypothetical protein